MRRNQFKYLLLRILKNHIKNNKGSSMFPNTKQNNTALRRLKTISQMSRVVIQTLQTFRAWNKVLKYSPVNAGCHDSLADCRVTVFTLTDSTMSSSTYLRIRLLQMMVMLLTILFTKLCTYPGGAITSCL